MLTKITATRNTVFVDMNILLMLIINSYTARRPASPHCRVRLQNTTAACSTASSGCRKSLLPRMTRPPGYPSDPPATFCHVVWHCTFLQPRLRSLWATKSHAGMFCDDILQQFADPPNLSTNHSLPCLTRHPRSCCIPRLVLSAVVRSQRAVRAWICTWIQELIAFCCSGVRTALRNTGAEW